MLQIVEIAKLLKGMTSSLNCRGQSIAREVRCYLNTLDMFREAGKRPMRSPLNKEIVIHSLIMSKLLKMATTNACACELFVRVCIPSSLHKNASKGCD